MGEGGIGESSQAASRSPGAYVVAGFRTVFLSYASADAAVANQVCEFLDSHGVSCWMASRDVKPGSVDRAFEWLDRAYEAKDHSFCFKGDPLLKNLEGDPRYKAFLKKPNLPE
jgi:hypothetical protein